MPTTPDTIIIERSLATSPERAFAAWADKDQRVQWDVPGNDWVIDAFEQDFREDGAEMSRFGPAGAPIAESHGRFLVIEPPRRIVSAGVMRSIERSEVSSVTMLTLDFQKKGDGTLLTLIDQSVFLGSGETGTMRRHGWDAILERLEAFLSPRS